MSRFRSSALPAFLFSLLMLGLTPTGRAQEHHGHSHHPPQGAAHDHRFNDIEKAVKMFESAERDAWQKPEEVMKQLQLRSGDVVVDIGAGTGYFTRRFAAAVAARVAERMGLPVKFMHIAQVLNGTRLEAQP